MQLFFDGILFRKVLLCLSVCLSALAVMMAIALVVRSLNRQLQQCNDACCNSRATNVHCESPLMTLSLFFFFFSLALSLSHCLTISRSWTPDIKRACNRIQPSVCAMCVRVYLHIYVCNVMESASQSQPKSLSLSLSCQSSPGNVILNASVSILYSHEWNTINCGRAKK